MHRKYLMEYYWQNGGFKQQKIGMYFYYQIGLFSITIERAKNEASEVVTKK